MPQSSSGALGEAKLMSRKALDAHTRPISGGGKIWFVSAHQQLCSIEGSKIRVVIPRWKTAAMAWNDAEHELWTLHPRNEGQGDRSVDLAIHFCRADSEAAFAFALFAQYREPQMKI